MAILNLRAQELEFRVVGGPLAQKLGIGAGVFNLIRCRTGKMVGSNVAHTVARGLDGVLISTSARAVKDGGHVGQFGPVELDVLPGGESDRNPCPRCRQSGPVGASGSGVQRAVRDGHTQHIGVQLQIKAVHQAQGAKLVLGQAEPSRRRFHLIGELGDTRVRTKASSKSE